MINPEFTIQPMSIIHLQNDQVAQLQKKVFPECYWETTEDLISFFQRPNAFGYVISPIEDTTINLGYIFGFPCDPTKQLPAIHSPSIQNEIGNYITKSCIPVFLYDCVVNPDYHGNGFGNILVNHFIHKTKELGYGRIWAVSVSKNAELFWIKKRFSAIETTRTGSVSISMVNDPCTFSMGSSEWWSCIESQKVLPSIYTHSGMYCIFIPIKNPIDSALLVHSLKDECD